MADRGAVEGCLSGRFRGCFAVWSGRRGRNGYQKSGQNGWAAIWPSSCSRFNRPAGTTPPTGVAPRSWSANLNYCTPCGYADMRICANAVGRYCVRSRWGSVGRFASLPLILGPPIALGCRRWGAGSCGRLSTLRLPALRRPGEPGDRAGSSCRNCIPALISLHYHRSPQPPVLYYCHCRFALS